MFQMIDFFSKKKKKDIRLLGFGINFSLPILTNLQSSTSSSHFINLSVSKKMTLLMGKVEESVLIVIIITY